MEQISFLSKLYGRRPDGSRRSAAAGGRAGALCNRSVLFVFIGRRTRRRRPSLF